MSFRDARTVEAGAGLKVDLCIIGAGAAGITLARELIDAPFQVALLEGGGSASPAVPSASTSAPTSVSPTTRPRTRASACSAARPPAGRASADRSTTSISRRGSGCRSAAGRSAGTTWPPGTGARRACATSAPRASSRRRGSIRPRRCRSAGAISRPWSFGSATRRILAKPTERAQGRDQCPGPAERERGRDRGRRRPSPGARGRRPDPRRAGLRGQRARGRAGLRRHRERAPPARLESAGVSRARQPSRASSAATSWTTPI